MSQETSPYHDLIRARLRDVLTDAHYDQLPGFGRGKVRDHYDLGDGRILMIATDRQSAFDQILASVPFKGQVLTGTARFWFEATKDVVANHVIAYPDPNVMVVRKMDMVPVEVVVRDYLTGSTSTSVWTMYEKGERKLYGVDFPDGMKKNEKLPVTLLTPTTKGAIGAHDLPITGEEIVSTGLMTKAKWQELAQTALALFARGREIAAKRGLILVDTKYEFGYDENGKLTLADEIHTPDSSRYWIAGSYEELFRAGEAQRELDKEPFRRWLMERGFSGDGEAPAIPDPVRALTALRYVQAYERIVGEEFAPMSADFQAETEVLARIVDERLR